mmetsp:Transcript_28045/g.42429  ORF Transcript_28045/g.42429 Transcript_28045/m.42429 type:complete len:466 (+) Transcript_28045:76-1473(+)
MTRQSLGCTISSFSSSFESSGHVLGIPASHSMIVKIIAGEWIDTLPQKDLIVQTHTVSFAPTTNIPPGHVILVPFQYTRHQSVPITVGGTVHQYHPNINSYRPVHTTNKGESVALQSNHHHVDLGNTVLGKDLVHFQTRNQLIGCFLAVVGSGTVQLGRNFNVATEAGKGALTTAVKFQVVIFTKGTILGDSFVAIVFQVFVVIGIRFDQERSPIQSFFKEFRKGICVTVTSTNLYYDTTALVGIGIKQFKNALVFIGHAVEFSIFVIRTTVGIAAFQKDLVVQRWWWIDVTRTAVDDAVVRTVLPSRPTRSGNAVPAVLPHVTRWECWTPLRGGGRRKVARTRSRNLRNWSGRTRSRNLRNWSRRYRLWWIKGRWEEGWRIERLRKLLRRWIKGRRKEGWWIHGLRYFDWRRRRRIEWWWIHFDWWWCLGFRRRRILLGRRRWWSIDGFTHGESQIDGSRRRRW